MRKIIARNVAVISAIFIVTMSIMLVVNYFQTRSVTPLQTEVVETLKALNDQNPGNPELQDQIRRLDLLSRKAYFVSIDHLMAGVYILIGMLVVLIVSLRIYYAGEKDIPDKNPDRTDEWDAKSSARRYIVWGASGLAAAAVVFSLLSLPTLRSSGDGHAAPDEQTVSAEVEGKAEAPAGQAALVAESGEMAPEVDMEAAADSAVAPVTGTETAPEAVAPAAQEAAPQVTVSKVTHNGFRGNNSDGMSSARGIPASWDLAAGTNIAWRHEVPRQGYNSPVINGDRVFFSGADNEVQELYCYSLSRGDKMWSLVASNIPGSPSAIPQTTADTGLAASTVATNGRQVCAVFATGDIICADMDGKRLWAKNLGVPDNHYGYASSPVMWGNLVIVQWDNSTDAKIVAFDAATGNVAWSKSRAADQIAWSSPMIASVGGSPRLIVMGTPAITAYDPASGEQLWRTECLSGEVGSSACFSDGVVFGASEYAKAVAIDAADGSLLWESTDYLPEVSSPVVAGGNLIVATSYGMAVAYDTKTGELKKEHELGEEFYSSPMVVDGKVYLISNSGKMFVFSADGFELLGSFETGERSFATPAFTDGRIVMRTQNSIYCVSES